MSDFREIYQKQFREYQELLTKHPAATNYDLVVPSGDVARFHRYDRQHAFVAIITKDRVFKELMHCTVH